MAKDYKGVEGVKAFVKFLIKMGYHRAEIFAKIISYAGFTEIDEKTKEGIVGDVVEESKNYSRIQQIVKSELICEVTASDNDKIIVLNLEERRVSEISRGRLIDLFDPKYDIKSHISIADFEYKPFGCFVTKYDDNGVIIFNSYKPPFWQEDYFYSNGRIKIPEVTKIPEIYNKYLMHLVDGKLPSYDYIIKWLANGLKTKNYCILTTIGDFGIGKGVLSDIMKMLFGSSNYHHGTDRMFKGVFNNQIENKRLVYCDEISIDSKQEEDRMKLVVNDHIEIEQKGKDVKFVENYANFYVSSNNFDSITITENDRRFSIIDLTSKKLIDVMNDATIKELFKDENIKQLAYYLWNIEVDVEEMKRVFKSERTNQVRDSSLKEWEEWWVFKYCQDNAGKSVDLWDAGEAVKEQFGYNTRIGRTKFDSLAQRYSKVFKLKQVKDNGRMIYKLLIGDKNEQSL